MTQTTSRYEARRQSSYGSLPWGIFDTQTGRFIEVKRLSSTGAFAGYVANFARKRDAQNAIDRFVVS